MSFAQLLLGFLGKNLAFASFVSGLISEDLIFIMSIIYYSKISNLLVIALFGFLGLVLQGIFIYSFTRYLSRSRTEKKFYHGLRNKTLFKFVKHIEKRNYFWTLFISKFVYGTRILSIIYVAHRESNIIKFIKNNLLATALWITVIIPIGFLAGKGFSELFLFLRGFEKILLIVIIVFVILKLLRDWVVGFKSEKKN